MTTTGVMHQTTGWTVDASTFAARLALVRMRMGWNIKEAARECGLAAATWRLWEVDGGVPRRHVEVAKTIADRTGCDYLWLLLGPDGGSGGDGGTTRQYFQDNRLVAAIGDDRPSSRRPVTRTRPRAAARPRASVARPRTPVAA